MTVMNVGQPNPLQWIMAFSKIWSCVADVYNKLKDLA